MPVPAEGAAVRRLVLTELVLEVVRVRPRPSGGLVPVLVAADARPQVLELEALVHYCAPLAPSTGAPPLRPARCRAPGRARRPRLLHGMHASCMRRPTGRFSLPISRGRASPARTVHRVQEAVEAVEAAFAGRGAPHARTLHRVQSRVSASFAGTLHRVQSRGSAPRAGTVHRVQEAVEAVEARLAGNSSSSSSVGAFRPRP